MPESSPFRHGRLGVALRPLLWTIALVGVLALAGLAAWIFGQLLPPKLKLEAHRYALSGKPFMVHISCRATQWKRAGSGTMIKVYERIDGRDLESSISIADFAGGWGISVQPGMRFRDGSQLDLKPGRHRMAIAMYDVPAQIKCFHSILKTFKELVSNEVDFEVVDRIPQGYFSPVHHEGWDTILKEKFAGFRYGLGDSSSLTVRWRGGLPCDLAFDVTLQAENGRTIPNLVRMTVKGHGLDYTCQYGINELEKMLEGLKNQRVRLVMTPSVEAALGNPEIRQYYALPFMTNWMPLKPDWQWIETQIEAGGGREISGEWGGVMDLGQRRDQEHDVSFIPGLIKRRTADGGGIKVKPGSKVRLLPLPEATDPAEAMRIVERNPERLRQGRVTEIAARPDQLTYLAVWTESGEIYFVLIDAARDLSEQWSYWKTGRKLDYVVVYPEGDGRGKPLTSILGFSSHTKSLKFEDAQGRPTEINWEYGGQNMDVRRYHFTLRIQKNGKDGVMDSSDIQYREGRQAIFGEEGMWVGIEPRPWPADGVTSATSPIKSSSVQPAPQ